LRTRKTSSKNKTLVLILELRRSEELVIIKKFGNNPKGGETEEGRVIKVNKGKSFAVGSDNLSTGKSTRDEKTTINVNGNKASALRAQLGAKGKK
jgi:hypothetical protein